MGINVHVESERGDIISAVYDDRNDLSRAVVGGYFSQMGVCLKYLDPYGDTVFNQLQLAALLEETEAAWRAAQSLALKDLLLDILNLIRAGQGQTHTYIRFVGD